MRKLHYTLQTLLRGGRSNVIKVISLTLGLFVGILLFARVAFELNYDSHYSEPDKLCYLQRQSMQEDGEWSAPSLAHYGPMASALRENFPAEVTSATALSEPEEQTYYYGDQKVEEVVTAFSDEHFFAATGIRLLQGNASSLKDVDVAFVSDAFARRLFGDASLAVGQTVLMKRFGDEKYPLLIRGVYQEIPENAKLRFDVLYSWPTYSKMAGRERTGWGFNISFYALARFRSMSDVPQVERRIGEMMKKYMPDHKNGREDIYAFTPVRGHHATQKEVRRMVTILSVLAFSLLLMAALNYVLISVSAIDQRSKSVGVHKCSGASGGNIFSMFLCETGLLLLGVLLLVGFLMIQFREEVEYIAEASLHTLFTWQVLWVPIVAVVGVFLLAGVLPGCLFASIPVTQVFRRYTGHRNGWKRPLLFVQFAGVPFILGLLMAVLLQYHHMVNKDMGYDPQGVVTVYHKFPDAGSLFRSLPMVQAYAIGNLVIGYSGDSYKPEVGEKIDIRVGEADPQFVPLMGIRVLKGKNFTRKGEILVNEEFVRRMRYTESPVGKQINYWGGPVTITGVMKDYPVKSAYFPQDAIILMFNPGFGAHTIRLKPPYDDNLLALNRTMKEMFPGTDIVFTPLQQKLDMQYDSVRRFRNAVMLASVSILLIALMGLLGYTHDEVRRRSKEIAIRKVNGAGRGEILCLLSSDVMWMALPAVVLGSVVSYFISREWLDQFAEQILLYPLLYVGLAIGTLLLIVACVVAKAARIANENPVKSIKSE